MIIGLNSELKFNRKFELKLKLNVNRNSELKITLV